MPAGSKYHFYRLASVHHLYPELTEKDFEKEFCVTREGSSFEGRGRSTVYGLGRILADFDVEIREGPAGTRYFDFAMRPPLDMEVIRGMVTLSDGESFIFMTGCWTGSDQKFWDVISLVPRLSYRARRQIVEHAIQLGFRREDFVFLDYDTCWQENPFLAMRFGQGSGRRGADRFISPVRPITSLKEMAELEERIINTNSKIEPHDWPLIDKYPNIREVEEAGFRRSVVPAKVILKRGGVS